MTKSIRWDMFVPCRMWRLKRVTCRPRITVQSNSIRSAHDQPQDLYKKLFARYTHTPQDRDRWSEPKHESSNGTKVHVLNATAVALSSISFRILMMPLGTRALPPVRFRDVTRRAQPLRKRAAFIVLFFTVLRRPVRVSVDWTCVVGDVYVCVFECM